ncbi:MAG: ImmA/IrrE family metallo-endopeptidase [Terriglobus roseus]|nr:ImmA/IrrE family metallo-endopeptidase [Terriglobus roseus]
MKPARPRFGLVEATAASLLKKSGIVAPSVPIADLIAAQGIRLMSPDLGKDASGVLVRKDGVTVIGVNRSHPKTRQRFTAAHELGHALLHGSTDVHHDADFQVNLRSDLSAQGTDPEEIEANYFAACLLMPRSFLEADPRAFFMDMEDPTAVAALARSYGVSAHAMSLRLARLSRVRS